VNVAFADTSFYLALLDERDELHERALAESKLNRPIVTTEFIILELGNACARAEDHQDFLAILAGMRASSRTTIVPMDSQVLQRGLDLYAGRSDKNWSLTDCTSFVVMHDRVIQESLTSDRHFDQAGFKALLA
jgi:predicted nucleic acid-binding protein